MSLLRFTFLVIFLLAFVESTASTSAKSKRLPSVQGIDWSRFMAYWKRVMDMSKQAETSISGGDNAVDCNEVACFLNPCQMASCPGQPDATCRTNNCGSCTAEFYLNGTKLSDADCADNGK